MKIAALQMVSTTRVDENLATAQRLIAQAARDGASISGADSPGLRSTLSTFGSSQAPVMRNSRVPAAISGLRRNSWARKVPMPMAGLIAA